MTYHATANAAKVAAGTYRPGTERLEVRHAPERPKMPAFVRKSRPAALIWKELMPQLAHVKLLARVDAFPLGVFCLLQAKLEDAEPGKIGLTSTEFGHWRQLACEFGLTPASRLRTPPLVRDEEPLPTKAEACESTKDNKVIPMLSKLRNTSKPSLQEK